MGKGGKYIIYRRKTKRLIVDSGKLQIFNLTGKRVVNLNNILLSPPSAWQKYLVSPPKNPNTKWE